jgi:hypothetical protein
MRGNGKEQPNLPKFRVTFALPPPLLVVPDFLVHFWFATKLVNSSSLRQLYINFPDD